MPIKVQRHSRSALQEYLTKRESDQRQAMLDAIDRQREERLGRSTDANIENMKAVTANTRANTASLEDTRTEARRAAAVRRAGETYRPGDVLGADADVPDELRQDQMSLPGRTIAMSTDARPGGSVPGVMAGPKVAAQTLESTPTGQETFRGTSDQRAEADKARDAEMRRAAIQNDPNIPASAKAAISAGVAPNAAMFESDQTKPIVRVSPDKTSLQIFKGGQWTPVGAEGVPKDAQLLMEPQPGDTEHRPYFIPLQTAQGIVSFDGRTGQVAGRVGDLKPGETAQRELANAQTIAWTMDQILSKFTPEKLGPIMGRFQTVEQAITGGDPDFTALSSEVSRLQNTVIQLRTGAQMSEHEAARIMNELPTVNLPPATFLARLQQTQAYFKEWQTNRATVSYGRTTAGDVDRVTGTTTATPSAQTTPTPAATPGAPRVRRYNPATGKVE